MPGSMRRIRGEQPIIPPTNNFRVMDLEIAKISPKMTKIWPKMDEILKKIGKICDFFYKSSHEV